MKVDWQDIIYASVNTFALGIIDSLSYHKTIPILVNCRPVALIVGQVLAANLFLLVGSVMVYHKGLSPALAYLTNTIDTLEQYEQTQGNDMYAVVGSHIVYVVYHANWIVPVCILCYVCSLVWYQEMADASYRFLKGIPKGTELMKSLGEGSFATVAWLMAYLKMQLFTILIPLGLDLVLIVVEYVFGTTGLFRGIFHSLLSSMVLVSKVFGFVLMSALYGWYAFDPFWISSGVSPGTRFDQMETHWAYFIGFGIPYALLMKFTSFFLGYGIFLALFPFCILLGGISNYQDAYAQQAVMPPRLPIYSDSVKLTKRLLGYVNSLPMMQWRSTAGTASSGTKQSSTQPDVLSGSVQYGRGVKAHAN